MGDLAIDSAVTPVGEGRYAATLSEEWNVWGPIGGYLASVALRAAGAETRLTRPASMNCQFLSTARFEHVDVAVERLRASRRAEALRVSMSQHGRAVLHATVWAVAGDLAGPRQRLATPPHAPPPHGLPTIEERAATEWGGIALPHLAHCDTRPVFWLEAVPERYGEPNQRGWVRLRPRATFPEDPWLDACRSLIHVDITPFPCVMLASPNDVEPFVAPTMDLQVIFHDAAPESEWLLVEGHASALSHGLAAGRAAVWSPDGRLLATGAQQMLCRLFSAPEQAGEPAATSAGAEAGGGP